MTENNYERYLNTYHGKELLKEHSLEEEGIWTIRGEDPNCDLGGFHYRPVLGHLKGKLEDVIREAVEMDDFWQWGAGGEIKKYRIPKIPKIRKVDTATKERHQLNKLLEQRKEINKQIAELKKQSYRGG